MKKLRSANTSLFLLSSLILASCGYKQNIMFKVSETTKVEQQVAVAEKNYIIQINDYLEIEVYTNKGERLIDPDLELTKDIANQNVNERTIPKYLVDIHGVAKFPMIGEIKLDGLRIREAEEVLQKSYAAYYTDAFVILRNINKRVIVLGAPGGQVIPLTNENMHLVEVLALAKGLSNDSKAHNIRVLRGNQVFVSDLSTFEGYTKNNLAMEPGDIVYVEPIRRPVSEGLRDYGLLISMISSLTTLVIVLIGI